jgi:NADH-quinone oxidoreductase subunit E
MLTEGERREIEAELPRYEQKRALCIEAMRIVQRYRGWVSDESIRDIAGLLEITPEELDSVGTFYNLIFRQPVGKHVIMLCDSVSCWIMGYEQMRERLKTSLGIDLGETTSDSQFTLLPIVCLGTCDHAPAMMVGDELYGDLDEAKVEEIIAKHRVPACG